MNRNASSLVIHGVNLSLGGPFDPESFGCGYTLICKQLRKLLRQGVVVVLSAGMQPSAHESAAYTPPRPSHVDCISCGPSEHGKPGTSRQQADSPPFEP